jgi:short-subunit dehydrogenase
MSVADQGRSPRAGPWRSEQRSRLSSPAGRVRQSHGSRHQTVVITGATSGVGRAAVREFAGRGARLVLLARGAEGLRAAPREVEQAGSEALELPTDIADAEQVEQAAATVERELGPIDVWVNNAMTSIFCTVRDLEPSEIQRVTEVTYLGTVFGTMAALKRMLARDRGSIVQVGSTLAYRAIPLQSAYCGAKHAVEGFTESLRAELIHEKRNVRLTMVQLPGVNTPQFDVVKSRLPRKAQPVPPIYQPEVAARAILWASEHARRQVYVGGSTAGTIIANKVVPGLLDRYLARTNIDAQQTDEPEDPQRPVNLWGATCGSRCRAIRAPTVASTSVLMMAAWQWWITTHRSLVAAGGAAVALLGPLLRWHRRSV